MLLHPYFWPSLLVEDEKKKISFFCLLCSEEEVVYDDNIVESGIIGNGPGLESWVVIFTCQQLPYDRCNTSFANKV